MKLKKLLFCIFSLTSLWAFSLDFNKDVKIHCSNDTIIINDLLLKYSSHPGTFGEKQIAIADEFDGFPYAKGTLEGSPERLTICIDSLDGITFIENVVALTQAASSANPTWRNFADILQNIRYRKGKLNGYPSRLHYMSDWIGENIYRGNITELTEKFPATGSTRMTLDYMTRHIDEYPALQDSTTLEDIRMVEMGFRAYRVPFLKKQAIANKELLSSLKDGDIMVFVPKIAGLDASNVGFIRIKDGIPYLYHASKEKGKVVLESQSIPYYLKHEGRTMMGFRILRLTD